MTMLKNLTKQYSVIHIAGKEYRVRYSLNALLCLEMTYKPLNEILAVPYREWGMEDVIQLVHAAMCGMPWNRKAVNRRDFEFVRPTVGELGEKIRMEDLPRLRTELLGAILDSMPDKKTEENTASQANDEGHIFAVAVDIIGMDENKFWDSTYKELDNRTEHYLEAKGMKKLPTLIQQYDDD